jgi:3-deoxy-D-manno-octulosonic-acid transferase
MDGASNAKHFFDAVQPKLVIFIKYEFWFYYLSEAKKRNIPTLLVAAIFRPNQIFFGKKKATP